MAPFHQHCNLNETNNFIILFYLFSHLTENFHRSKFHPCMRAELWCSPERNTRKGNTRRLISFIIKQFVQQFIQLSLALRNSPLIHQAQYFLGTVKLISRYSIIFIPNSAVKSIQKMKHTPAEEQQPQAMMGQNGHWPIKFAINLLWKSFKC